MRLKSPRRNGLWKLRPTGRCNLSRKRDFLRLSRGLRFRLTAGYALFFALLLIGVADLFRQRLATVQDREVHEILDQQWAAMKGYMRIEEVGGKYVAAWYYDTDDPDETTIVLDIRKIYMVADQNGNPITEFSTGENAVSTAYQKIGVDPPAEIRQRLQDLLM